MDKLTKRTGGLIAFLFFVLPHILISIAKNYEFEWIGRLIGIWIFHILAILILLYVLIPKVEIIPKWGKINRVTSQANVKIIEKILKLITAMFLIFFVHSITGPFTLDTIDLINGTDPIIIEGKVKDQDALSGMWHAIQHIKLYEDPPGSDSYALMYHGMPISEEKTYKFMYLPKSREILEIEEIST